MVILDEIIGACKLGFVDEAKVAGAIRHKPLGLEVILTGRGPSGQMLEQADYVTEMAMVRHPFEQGTGAREGIEY